MEFDQEDLSALFPNLTAQLRSALSNLRLASGQLAPASAREQDPKLDARAALLDRSYYQLLRLVNNLSVSAYLRRSTPLPRRDEDVVEIVSGVCEEAGSLAELLHIDLRFVCAMPRHICAVSRFGVEELLFQLLSNAFRAAPAGGTVTVELKKAGGSLHLSVADTGPGLPPGQADVIFDLFRSEDLSLMPHGLGLGLPLCRRIAEDLGGRILADSPPGKGARFVVSLPDGTTGESGVSDVPLDYSGGFSRALLALSDALPAEAFLLRNQN